MSARVLLWTAAGDALGVPFEGVEHPVEPLGMTGHARHGFAPGEWSDDTSLSVAIALAARQGIEDGFLDRVATWFARWEQTSAKGIGPQTRHAIREGARLGASAESLTHAARTYRSKRSRIAGNGALMRSAIVGALSDDRDTVARLSREICLLTHAHPDCVSASVLWSEMVRCARLGNPVRPELGFDLLAGGEVEKWRVLVYQAEHRSWDQLVLANRSAVGAFQQSWALASRSRSAVGALRSAVLGGGDTDTVAAITGPLVAMMHPSARLPVDWVRTLNGWPGLSATGLVRLGREIEPEPVPGSSWDTPARHGR